ncbi:MAG: hypothetical protein J7L11_05740 [Thermoprotei archaeon]|nr:hypothetical protein [Thermoprotei archaeon]
MIVGKKLRLRRLFPRGRSIVIAIDHGSYWGHISGLEDPIKVVKRISETDADAIAATPSTLIRVADAVGDLAIVARLDSSVTVYDEDMENDMLISTVEHAVSIGADAAMVMCYFGGARSSEQQRKLGMLATECTKFGLPLIVEALPAKVIDYHFKRRGARERSLTDFITLEDIMVVSRVSAELGADVIKTYYLGNVNEYRKVVENACVPILVLGGPKTKTTEEFLKAVKDAMEAGAKGIVVGRNVWQRENVKVILKALSAIVHEDKDVDYAKKILQKG